MSRKTFVVLLMAISLVGAQAQNSVNQAQRSTVGSSQRPRNKCSSNN